MTFNRRSIKWLPKFSFNLSLGLLMALAVLKLSNNSPEMDMFNSLERVNSLQMFIRELLF